MGIKYYILTSFTVNKTEVRATQCGFQSEDVMKAQVAVTMTLTVLLGRPVAGEHVILLPEVTDPRSKKAKNAVKKVT